ncbi:palmitoyltransferase ZDHHC16B [Sardina pilchardus]|uniref:palmitoyltransferase ZDHHC16B n=1 Tax=Sardina pilchardus TaxID=27697 RepID=UPI002E114898
MGGVTRSWRWLVARVMRVLLRCGRRLCGGGRGHAGHRLRLLWRYWLLLLRSLYFNSLCNSDTVLDAVFEPIYWLVDNLTRWFGVVFVCLVVALTSSVVLIVYTCVLPVILENYAPYWVLWHLCYGHWNLLMITYHYYRATRTSPGHPPQERRDVPTVTMCKKCIVPKPARTHHCSICNRCILKMDHHCPWLNNCVGHFNHRYFYCFCLFMTMGCVYCSSSSLDMFIDAYNAVESSYQTPAPPFTFSERLHHKCIIYLWVLTSSVALALGGLTLWHSVMILRGETSVERHINRKEAKRLQQLGKVFRNPYHFGRVSNFKILFGVEKRSHWVTRVLLPSSHPPHGDGLIWMPPPRGLTSWPSDPPPPPED